MPKCKGHVHLPDGKVGQCGSELRNVAFIKGEDGKIEERYTCDNEECSRYHDNQGENK